MRSQGGVQFPTGGDGNFFRLHKPASARRGFDHGGVSRFGVIPKPTVIVRMKETRCVCAPLFVFPHKGPLLHGAPWVFVDNS